MSERRSARSVALVLGFLFLGAALAVAAWWLSRGGDEAGAPAPAAAPQAEEGATPGIPPEAPLPEDGQGYPEFGLPTRQELGMDPRDYMVTKARLARLGEVPAGANPVQWGGFAFAYMEARQVPMKDFEKTFRRVLRVMKAQKIPWSVHPVVVVKDISGWDYDFGSDTKLLDLEVGFPVVSADGVQAPLQVREIPEGPAFATPRMMGKSVSPDAIRALEASARAAGFTPEGTLILRITTTPDSKGGQFVLPVRR